MTTRALPTSPSPTHHHQHHLLHLLLPFTSLLLLFLLVVLFYFFHRHIHRHHHPSPSPSTSLHIPTSVPQLPLHLLLPSLGNPSLSLGHGASSHVYLLPTLPAALKLHLDPSSFLHELLFLSSIPPSPFITSLLAYSSHPPHHHVLLLEYLPNGSLHHALFSSHLLDWPRRLLVLLDVAHALSFLHLDCHPPIIHNDVKPSNVLLDAHLRAKLSDFVLAQPKSHTPQDRAFLSEPAKNPVSDDGSSPISHPDHIHHRWSNEEEGEDLKNTKKKKRKKKEPENVDICCSNSGSRKPKKKMREWWKDEEEQKITEIIGEKRSTSEKQSNQEKKEKMENWLHNCSISCGEDPRNTRGTVCYVAPEVVASGNAAEPADIYSLGVLILVVVSGRRPIHITESPMELEKANLISWCRQLASSKGDLMEIVDERLHGEYDAKQVELCIRLALLCLQRSPELRPGIAEVVRILKGEAGMPPLPALPSRRSAGRTRTRRREM